MDITDFLKLPFAKSFTLLAGEHGTHHQITGVNILDNPKASDWLSPGELIVTSGYFFSESPEALERFLTHFHRLNIAGICIKPQIYLTPLPKALIERCNELAIPLIEIPYGIAFSKILNTVMNLLSNESNEANQMALDFSSDLLEAGLKGDGFTEVQHKLETLLGNPLIITNQDWSLLVEHVDEAFLPYIQKNTHQMHFQKEAFDTLPPNLAYLKHPSSFALNNQQTGTILPVFFNDITYGYLIVLQKNRDLNRKDYLALEHASITVALEIVHRTEKERIQNKVLRDFYRELLFGHSSIEDLSAFNIEFNYEIPYTVFIVALDSINEDTTNLVQQKYEEERTIRQVFAAAKFFQDPIFTELHLFKQGGYFIGLVGHAKQQTKISPTMEQQFFEAFQAYLLKNVPSSFYLNIYVGTKQEIDSLTQSYREAKRIIDYQKPAQSKIYFAQNFYFELFLRQHIQTDDAMSYVKHYLAPLLIPKNQDLLETLTAYLDNHLNLAATSRDLFIHRNTLLYRITKIEKILGYPLDTSQATLSLQLALHFLREYGKE